MKKFSEMAGTFGIVSCKDFDNPNFKVWGARPPGCGKGKEKVLNMKFKDWVRNKK